MIQTPPQGTSEIIYVYVYMFIFFLHLFILQAIYIVSQDLKMEMLFVEQISGYKNKWRGQDIVKLTYLPYRSNTIQ